jgi:hypothetical protein
MMAFKLSTVTSLAAVLATAVDRPALAQIRGWNIDGFQALEKTSQFSWPE